MLIWTAVVAATLGSYFMRRYNCRVVNCIHNDPELYAQCHPFPRDTRCRGDRRDTLGYWFHLYFAPTGLVPCMAVFFFPHWISALGIDPVSLLVLPLPVFAGGMLWDGVWWAREGREELARLTGVDSLELMLSAGHRWTWYWGWGRPRAAHTT